MSGVFDIAIIGGGIHGCGVARDAAGRGFSVLLCEQDDLGGATSAASTKLVHGGLRYLEHGALRLVREALGEREALLRAAPHLIRPLRFVMPPGRRPAWLLRCGLLLYDMLARRDILPGSETIDLRRHPAGEPLKAQRRRRAFCYSDCWADDARLVIANAIAAREAGADIRIGVKVEQARRDGGQWRLFLKSKSGGASEARARALINAAGPWVDEVFASSAAASPDAAASSPAVKSRLVKGSHIIVPKLFSHPAAYLLQNRDRRVIFAIPYEENFTLIGATDIEFSGDPASAQASADEINYLCAAIADYFAGPPTPAAVVDSFAGVRALADDGSGEPRDISRDYKLRISGGKGDMSNGGVSPESGNPPRGGSPPGSGDTPLIEIVGGKLTTYRKLAEAVIAKLAPTLGDKCNRHWTKNAKLPGGDLVDADGRPTLHAAQFSLTLLRDYPFLHPPLALRLARAYGAKARDMLGDAQTAADLGNHFGGDFYEREADYLKRQEWTTTAQAALRRRSKLYLHLDAQAQEKVTEWFGI